MRVRRTAMSIRIQDATERARRQIGSARWCGVGHRAKRAMQIALTHEPPGSR